MNSRPFAFVVTLTSYCLLLMGKSSDSGEVTFSLDDEVHKNFTSDIKATINRTFISSKNAEIHRPSIISRETSMKNTTKYSYEDLKTAQQNGKFVERNDNKNSINKPYMDSLDSRKNGTALETADLNTKYYDIENDEIGQMSLVNANRYIEKNSEDDTIISINNEDFDMEFERIFGDTIEGGNNLNHEPNVSIRQPKVVNLRYSLNDSNILRNSEPSYEKYQLPDIESASFIFGGKTLSTTAGPSTSTTTSPYNYFRTTHLLTSDVEINGESFVISRSDSRNPSQLELQDDWFGNASTHEAAVSRVGIDKTIYVLPSLIVELGEGNSLWLNPNVRQDLYYEVTNNLNSAVQIRFKVTDEQSILWNMDKYNVRLSPHSSTRVRLTVIPRLDIATDRIIFNAIGPETVQKEAIVRVTKNYLSDNSPPLVDYSYTSDCTDLVISDCHKGTWTIKVLARDQESGLMLLTTIPKGLHFPDGYTAGTKEEVAGYFSDTCCNPDLQIIAVDTLNNRIVKLASAYSAPLNFWAITAIVLACLIILAIIIAIVICCVKRYKKNQAGSFDLPTYMGRSRF